MTPYYDVDGITIYHGDCLDLLPDLQPSDFAVLLTDPPYGIGYSSNRTKLHRIARSIRNDATSDYRDAVLEWWGQRPAIVFGSPSADDPQRCRTNLVWHKPGSGMGALDLPWKPDYEFIHVLGKGFSGNRDTSVLTYPLRVFRGDLRHPHEKPIDLIRVLLAKCPDGPVLDPFMGSGPIAQACADLGRRYIGVELVEDYCRVAVDRLSQQVLDLSGGAA